MKINDISRENSLKTTEEQEIDTEQLIKFTVISPSSTKENTEFIINAKIVFSILQDGKIINIEGKITSILMYMSQNCPDRIKLCLNIEVIDENDEQKKPYYFFKWYIYQGNFFADVE